MIKRFYGRTHFACMGTVIRLFVGAALVLSIAFCGCGKNSPEDAPESAANTAEPVVDNTEQTDVSVTETSQRNAFDGRIETPVGTFIFPEEYASRVTADVSEDEEYFAETFYSLVGDKDIRLFKLSVCDTAQGYSLGSAPDSEGNMQKIWLEIEGIETDPDWTEEQTKEVELIQSCVNDLIEQIRGLEGYEEPN